MTMLTDAARVLVRTPAPTQGLTEDAGPSPRQLHRTLPGYAVTPLRPLEQLADDLGIAGIWVKDESWRLELPSFKVLGGFWAVHRLVLSLAGRSPEGVDFDALRTIAREVGPLTLATATDGNHGRGVARAARTLGFRAVVYVPRGTAQARIDAIAEEGAQVVVHPGSYDAAVARAARDAAANGWQHVADVAVGDDVTVPTWVMDGYRTIFDEADEQLGTVPTALFLQAGVGALAAAAARHYVRAAEHLGARPRLATVEPLSAACLLASAAADQVLSIDASHDSIMAGLNCGTPSEVAWPTIVSTVCAYLAVPDEIARQAMRHLADAGVVAGESGAAGLAGLLVAAEDRHLRDVLGLHADAHVLLINTEGATDPESYKQIVGETPERVRERVSRHASATTGRG